MRWILALILPLLVSQGAFPWLMPSALSQEPEAGALLPPGNFLPAKEEQLNRGSYTFCSERGLLRVQGWLRKQVYRLQPGAPRPSVVDIRRHLSGILQRLGARALFEGRCVEMDPSDPRADHVILTGLIPTAWGDLYVEVWPWEEGEELHCQITLVQEEPQNP